MKHYSLFQLVLEGHFAAEALPVSFLSFPSLTLLLKLRVTSLNHSSFLWFLIPKRPSHLSLISTILGI
jgi:hypothetical protein